MAATKTVQCLCQSFEFGEFDGENELAVSYDTDCAQTTTRTFAQGHDAKLVGFLVRADMAGEEIRMTTGGISIHFMGAVDAAAKVSGALAVKAEAQLAAAAARVAKKANKPAKKAAKTTPAPVVELAPTTRHATIKVGRWTYRAAIMLATGEAHYSSKLGADKVAPAGTFTEVN